MDYYHSLLESYELLKQRKFKLSLKEKVFNTPEDAADAARMSPRGSETDMGPTEAGGGGPEQKAKGLVGQATALFSKKKQDRGSKNSIPVNAPDGSIGQIWAAEKNDNVNFSSNEKGTYPQKVEGEEGPGWDLLVGFLRDGKKEGGGEGGGGKETIQTPEEVAEAALVDATRAAAEKIEDLLEGEEDETTGERDGGMTRYPGDKPGVDYFPGLIPNPVIPRLARAMKLIADKISGKDPDAKKGSKDRMWWGVRKQARDRTRDKATGVSTLEEKLLASPDISTENVARAVEGYEKLLSLVKKLHVGSEPPTRDELREIQSRILLTDNGVIFISQPREVDDNGIPKGVLVTYSSDSNSETDPIMNGALQLQEVINKHNKEGSKLTGEAKQEWDIPPIEDPTTSPTANLARRGQMVEHIIAMQDLTSIAESGGCLPEDGGLFGIELYVPEEGSETLKNEDMVPSYHPNSVKEIDCDKVNGMLDEVLLDMKETGKGLEVAEVFKIGTETLAGKRLADEHSIDDADFVTGAYKFLVEEEGWSAERAGVLIQRAAEGGEDGMVALATAMAAMRGYQKFTEDMELLSSWVTGTLDSDLQGQKIDNKKRATTESVEKFAEKMKDEMEEIESELEEAAKCTGEEMGWDAIALDSGEEGVSEVGFETKSRDTLTKGRTKMGEGVTSRMSEMCRGKTPEEIKNEKEEDKAWEEAVAAGEDRETLDKAVEAGDTIKERERKKAVESGEVMEAEEPEEGGLSDEDQETLDTGEDAQGVIDAADDAQKRIDRRKKEHDFDEATERRINQCVDSHMSGGTVGSGFNKKAPFGKHTTGKNKGKPMTMKEAACSLQSEVDKAMAPEKAMLDGSNLDGPNQSAADRKIAIAAGNSVLTSWLKSKGKSPSADETARFNSATDGLSSIHAGEPTTTAQRLALRKIFEQLEMAKIAEIGNGYTFNDNANSDNAGYSGDRTTSEGKLDPTSKVDERTQAYIMYRMVREGSSLQECVKDVRSYKERDQRVGCINPGVFGPISMVLSGRASLQGGATKQGKPSNQWDIVRNTPAKDSTVPSGKDKGKESTGGGEKLSGLKFERGKGTATIEMDGLSKTQVGTPKTGKEDSSIMLSFLKGQHKLLETLLNQAT